MADALSKEQQEALDRAYEKDSADNAPAGKKALTQEEIDAAMTDAWLSSEAKTSSAPLNPLIGAGAGAAVSAIAGHAVDSGFSSVEKHRLELAAQQQALDTQLANAARQSRNSEADQIRHLEDRLSREAGMPRYMRGNTGAGGNALSMMELDPLTQALGQENLGRVTDAARVGERLLPGTRIIGSPDRLVVAPEQHYQERNQNARQDEEAFHRARIRASEQVRLDHELASIRAGTPITAPSAGGTGKAFLRGVGVPAKAVGRAGIGARGGQNITSAWNEDGNTTGNLLNYVTGGAEVLAGAIPGKAKIIPAAIGAAGELLKKYFNDAAAERKAAGGSVQHFATAGVVKKAGQELIGRGVDTLMPALKNSGLFFPKVQPQPASKVLDPYRNEYFGSTTSDRLITRLGRSKEKGGARFSTLSTVDPAYAGSVWGSGNANAASALANMQRDYPGIIIAPRVGTAEMHRSSAGVSDRVLRGFQKAVDQGLLPDDLRAAMNAKLAGHKKYVSQDGKPFFEPDIDVGAPDFADRLKTFEQRAAATETLGGEGVSRGRPDKGQIFDYDSIIRNTTEPGLLDVPVNSVGPRLFKLTGKYSHRPELNASYPYVHGGEDLGVEMMMTPHTALFPDKLTEMEAAIAAKVAAGTRKDPNVGSMDLSRNKLIQKMDPGFFHRLEDMGYNEGGEVGGLDALDRAYA